MLDPGRMTSRWAIASSSQRNAVHNWLRCRAWPFRAAGVRRCLARSASDFRHSSSSREGGAVSASPKYQAADVAHASRAVNTPPLPIRRLQRAPRRPLEPCRCRPRNPECVAPLRRFHRSTRSASRSKPVSSLRCSAVGLRQDHAGMMRIRPPRHWPDPLNGTDLADSPPGAARCARCSRLRALSAHDRRGQRRLSAADGRTPAGEVAGKVASARRCPPQGLRKRYPHEPPAGRNGARIARALVTLRRCPARRAARGSMPNPRRNAARTHQPAEGGRHHVRLRDARPDRARSRCRTGSR